MTHEVTQAETKEKLPLVEIAAFLPYRIRESGEIEFFLQKRNMKTNFDAGKHSLFGGRIEEVDRGTQGATQEKNAMLREVGEELINKNTGKGFDASGASYVGCYHKVVVHEDVEKDRIAHIFTQKVNASFESTYYDHEGDALGARFFTIAEYESSETMEPKALECMKLASEYIVRSKLKKV